MVHHLQYIIFSLTLPVTLLTVQIIMVQNSDMPNNRLMANGPSNFAICPTINSWTWAERGPIADLSLVTQHIIRAKNARTGLCRVREAVDWVYGRLARELARERLRREASTTAILERLYRSRLRNRLSIT